MEKEKLGPRVFRETRERSRRIEHLHRAIEKLFPGEELQHLREKIVTSLSVPQFGKYHNEGLYMDTHLALSLRHLDGLRRGRIPQGVHLSEEVGALFTNRAREHFEALQRYVFLHDISKMDCLTVEYQDGRSESVTWNEWQAQLPEELMRKPHPTQLLRFFQSVGITDISYYQKSSVVEENGKQVEKPGKIHGREGAAFVRSLDQEIVPSAVITAIEKHEVAYQFSTVNVAAYEKHFSGLSEDERNFALVASLLDTLASIRSTGQPELNDFYALLASKHNYEVYTSVAGSQEVSQAIQEKRADKKKVEAALKKLKESEAQISDSPEAIIERMLRECTPSQYDVVVVASGLEQLVVEGRLPSEVKDLILRGIRNGLRMNDLARDIVTDPMGKKAINEIKQLLIQSERSSYDQA